MVSLSALLQTADPIGAGRFDKLCISEQSRIELFVENFTDVDIAKDDAGKFLDISAWSILEFDNEKIQSICIRPDHADREEFFLGDSSDEDAAMANRSITSSCFAPGGLVDFQYVPPTLQSLEIEDCELRGTLDTASLPASLRVLQVNRNQLKGPFDTKSLPQEIRTVNISSNKFSGSLVIEALPSRIENFNASKNNFSGAINLCELPISLCSLLIHDNALSGKLEMRNVPKTLGSVMVHMNEFDTEAAVIDAQHAFRTLMVPIDFMNKIFDADGKPVRIPGMEYYDDSGSEFEQLIWVDTDSE